VSVIVFGLVFLAVMAVFWLYGAMRAPNYARGLPRPATREDHVHNDEE